MRQALDAKPLTVFGDGSQTRSFCYVDDLIRGLILLVESGEHMPVNIGNPGSTRSSSSPRPCSPRRDRPARSCTKPCRSTIRRCGSPTSRARASSSAGSPRSRSTRAFAARWRRSPGPRACVGRPRRSPQPRSASRSSSLPPRAARIRCASGSSTTASSSTATRPRLPTARPDRCRLLRVNLWWAGPGIRVSTRGRGARPTRTTAPTTGTPTTTVRFAIVNGIEPVFSILGTPPWANRARGWNVAPTNARDLRLFAARRAEALQRHLQNAEGVTPRVSLWMAWNEPNNLFSSSRSTADRAGWTIQSGRDYAKICNAVVQGIKSVQRSSKVACGATSRGNNNNPNSSRPSVSPLPFPVR